MRKVDKEKEVGKTDWVEAENFSFGIVPRLASSRNNKRIGRESTILKVGKDQKYGRKSLNVKNGIDLLNNSINSPPVSFRTRRQSMAVFPKMEIMNKNTISRTKSEKVIPKRTLSKEKLPKISTSSKLPTEHDAELLNNIVNQRVKSMNKLPDCRKSYPKLTRSKPLIEKTNCTKTELDYKADNTAPAKMHRNRGSAHLTDINSKNILIKKVSVKKPLKRLATSVTPAKSPLYSNKRLTRSAKKRVKIVAASPVQLKEGLKKFPNTNKGQGSSASIKNSSIPVQSSGKMVSSINKRRKDFLTTPFTPKPEEPSNIIKQSMRKKIAINMEAVTDQVQSQTSLKSPQKEITISNEIYPNTPVSVSNLPSTPKSARTSSLRRIRIRSTCVENNIEDNASICSILEEKPRSSTPITNVTNQEDSDLNCSLPPCHSKATDILDSFSESLSESEISDSEEIEPEAQPEKNIKSFCSIM